ncbi:MAG: penicillin-binding transpeptidase domain-containing protein [Actinomycetota bacterium]|nr:hypothetical protein [Actinomycetota bacterium]
MNTSVRKISLILALAFVALFVNLNIIQLGKSKALDDNPLNRRRAYAEEKVKRGEILAHDGTVLAESVPSGDPTFTWSRRYPQGALFGQITGYYTSPFFCDSTGIERYGNDYLSGRAPTTTQGWVDSLLGRTHEGNRVQLTVDPGLQRLAQQQLQAHGERGGAAVIDTRTGAVLALYGNPSYDPNVVTSAKLNACTAAKARLERLPQNPLLSRAYQVRYPAGSTFKIITASAGIELGGMTLNTSFRATSRLSLPNTTKTLGNFGGEFCGGSLLRSFEVSCNTAFAQLALRIKLGKLVSMAERYGLDSQLPIELNAIPACVASPPSGFTCDTPDEGNAFPPYVGIGQQSVGVTPLQMALVGATVENGGQLMKPHVVSKVLDAETNSVLVTIKPDVIRRVLSTHSDQLMRKLMTGVVCAGTGTVVHFRHPCSGQIGGKTGTAQTGRPGEPPHVWFVAWGPHIAVAVVVENGGTLKSEATGGKVAGPVARALLEYAMDHHLA